MQAILTRQKQKFNTRDHQWLAQEIQAAIDDPRPSISHEEVMAQMKQLIEDLTHEKQ